MASAASCSISLWTKSLARLRNSTKEPQALSSKPSMPTDRTRYHGINPIVVMMYDFIVVPNTVPISA